MQPRSRRKGEEVLAAGRLEKALLQPGCPLCRRVREAEEQWIWNVLYELSGDPETHERFAASLGLCREHAALMAQVVRTRELVSPTSVARLYESVVAYVLGALPDLHSQRRLLRKNCPLCEIARETGAREAWFLGRLLLKREVWTAYERSGGLCLPHFLLVLRQAPPEIRPELREEFRERLASLLHRLRELQRKERFDVDEPLTPEETASWWEALWRLGGMSYFQPLIGRG